MSVWSVSVRARGCTRVYLRMRACDACAWVYVRRVGTNGWCVCVCLYVAVSVGGETHRAKVRHVAAEVLARRWVDALLRVDGDLVARVVEEGVHQRRDEHKLPSQPANQRHCSHRGTAMEGGREAAEAEGERSE